MMRIITGKARGTRLEAPKSDKTRPTTEMAKEGVFSSIQFDLEGRTVLDLFAGTGQLGLEALSRGAAKAVFVDSDAESFEIIKKNAQKTGLYPQCRILRMEYGEYIKAASREGASFDYIFLDPPYRETVVPETVKRILKAGLLKPGGKIFCESDDPELFGADNIIPENESFTVKVKEIKIYRYGKTFFHTVCAEQNEVNV